MIISHKHRFIFIKTKKTAGTSIEISLSRYCGKEDVITPIDPKNEEIRKKLNIFPQNYLKLPLPHQEKTISIEKNDSKKYWNHATAGYVREQLGEKIWNSYFKFCFERNPWDKVVSLYFFRANHPNQKRELFNEFFMRSKIKFNCYNFPSYTDNDSVIVDFIGRYENLNDELKKICKKIGFDFDGWLPNAKGEYRTEKKHYTEYYDSKSRKQVENYFKKEIKLFGYKFES